MNTKLDYNEMETHVKFKRDGEYVYGNLIGIFQYAEPYTAILRDQTSGQIAYPVAVIDTLDDGFVEIRANRVQHMQLPGSNPND